MRLLITLTICLLLAVPVLAGTRNNVVYGGLTFEDNKLSGGFGTGQKLTGNLWLLESTIMGQDKSAGADIVYFVSDLVGLIPASIEIGLLAGPSADWLNNYDQPTIAYLTATTGGIVSYTVFTNEINAVGLWGYGKYFFDYTDDNLYTGRWRLAAGLSMMF